MVTPEEKARADAFWATLQKAADAIRSLLLNDEAGYGIYQHATLKAWVVLTAYISVDWEENEPLHDAISALNIYDIAACLPLDGEIGGMIGEFERLMRDPSGLEVREPPF